VRVRLRDLTRARRQSGEFVLLALEPVTARLVRMVVKRDVDDERGVVRVRLVTVLVRVDDRDLPDGESHRREEGEHDGEHATHARTVGADSVRVKGRCGHAQAGDLEQSRDARVRLRSLPRVNSRPDFDLLRSPRGVIRIRYHRQI
jgi:hypothetical protein